MDIHKNARLSLRGREDLVRLVGEGLTRKAAAAAFRVSPKTVSKWVGRYLASGSAGLVDRSSRPRHSPRRLSSSVAERVIELRRGHMPGYEIARRTGMSPASVSRILRRARLSRWRDLNPPPPIQRYEHPRPGDLLHLDIKGMTRFSDVTLRGDGRLRGRRMHRGFLALHVAVDDHSRLAFTQLLPDQKADHHRLPARRGGVLRHPRHKSPRPAHRQRLQLPLSPLPARLPPDAAPSQPNQAIHP
jgi:transposase